MIRIRKCIFALFLFIFSFLQTLLFTGCWGSSQASLPEAPPPYPNSSFPESSSSYQDYTPPPSPDPRGNFIKTNPDSFSRTNNSSSFSTVRSTNKFYTLEALGTIWVLVQDKYGNELEWISLVQGDKVPLKHMGALTITCSSGESLRITAPNGKFVQPSETKKGISIIRLP